MYEARREEELDVISQNAQVTCPVKPANQIVRGQNPIGVMGSTGCSLDLSLKKGNQASDCVGVQIFQQYKSNEFVKN